MVVGFALLLLASLTQVSREWPDLFCSAVRLAVAALPSMAAVASDGLQVHAGQCIVEGLLQVSGCLGTIMLNLVTRA